MLPYFGTLNEACDRLREYLRDAGTEVKHDKWQGLDMSVRGPEWNHFEATNAGFIAAMFPDPVIRPQCGANLPWAEDHFQERVGGKPLNPGNQYDKWPHWTPASYAVLETPGANGMFTHTYMERFWPKMAGRPVGPYEYTDEGNHGIRYVMGDLNDVVQQLLKDPYSRQAYLPIFFPEDTGAVHGGRVPCTLGYHFMMRNDKLHLWYEIRSCDYLRHFRDDIYMAVRLAQWMKQQLEVEFHKRKMQNPRTMSDRNIWKDVEMGNLTFLAHSFHVFMGDVEAGRLA